jgi:hypothetical protein
LCARAKSHKKGTEWSSFLKVQIDFYILTHHLFYVMVVLFVFRISASLVHHWSSWSLVWSGTNLCWMDSSTNSGSQRRIIASQNCMSITLFIFLEWLFFPSRKPRVECVAQMVAFWRTLSSA